MARWSNWAGDQRCEPAARVEPSSAEELGEALDGASRVRVAGSGHSFSEIALTDGLQISLRRFDRVLDDDGAGLVREQGGVVLHELGIERARRGLAMQTLDDVDGQCLAGALAGRTRGTGVGFQNLSSQVQGMK